MRRTLSCADARASMVEDQLRRRGIQDENVLRAMGEVQREAFVPSDLVAYAYDDAPLPIDAGQTISQPFMVATMIEAAAIKPRDRVLEVGTGSGYAAAVLSRIAVEVFSIERKATLYEAAKQRLARERGCIHLRLGDGHLGWPDASPFDAILVAAAAASIPPALKCQLALGGRLVAPVGDNGGQRLRKLTRTTHDVYAEESLAPVLFVPLIEGEVK